VAVFALREVDLHLDGPTGPVVAKARVGAAVMAVPDVPGFFKVTVAGFAPRPSEKPNVANVGFLTLFGESNAFTTEPMAPPPPERPKGRLVRDWHGEPIYPSATSSSTASFAVTNCGDIYVTDGPANRSRIVQEVHGVEISGFTLDEIFQPLAAMIVPRGPLRACSARQVVETTDGLISYLGSNVANAKTIDEIPGYYVGSDHSKTDALATSMTSGGTVHWLVIDSKKSAVCRPWAFAHPRGPSEDGLMRLLPPIERAHVEAKGSFVPFEGERVYASFETTYREGVLLMEGPHYSSRPRASASVDADRGGYRCLIGYTFVGVREGALRMSYLGNAAAWHPDDEELWYLTKDACESAAIVATRALLRDPDAKPPGGPHIDCFDELAP
jgi:hypothetical protein